MSSNDSLDSITTTTIQLPVESRKHFFSFFTTLNFLVSIPETFLFVEFPPLSWGIFILYCFFSVYFLINTFVRRISSSFVFIIKGIYFSDWDKWFLVMCTRLYAPLCRSVGRSQVLALFDFQVKRERILIFFSLSAFWDLRVESEISQNGWLIRRSIRCSEGP